MQLKWGIIGCGNVTEVKSGPAFQKIPGSILHAVMRRNLVKAEDYARRHGVKKWYGDADQLINDPEVNAVYVATPPSTHELYAIKALEAGKPVYLEKPMAPDAKSAQRIAEKARLLKGKISIAHYRRAQPLFLRIRDLLSKNTLGRVGRIELRLFQPYQTDLIAKTEDNWRIDPAISGGGLFHDLAPHQLDLMNFFFGEPAQIEARAWNEGGHYAPPDRVEVFMKFADGIQFMGSWNFNHNEKVDECVIEGEKGCMRFSIFGSPQLVISEGSHEESIRFDPIEHVQQPMIEKVCAFFRGEGANPCTAEEGVRVMQQIDACTQG